MEAAERGPSARLRRPRAEVSRQPGRGRASPSASAGGRPRPQPGAGPGPGPTAVGGTARRARPGPEPLGIRAPPTARPALARLPLGPDRLNPPAAALRLRAALCAAGRPRRCAMKEAGRAAPRFSGVARAL